MLPTNTPNYELLKDAYAILGGIPDKAINLDYIRQKQGRTLSCGTISCGIGWLASHPTFKKMGLNIQRPKRGMAYADITWRGKKVNYDTAAANIFGISKREANDLFTSSNYYGGTKVNHKHELLNRIMHLLEAKGQVDNPVYLTERE